MTDDSLRPSPVRILCADGIFTSDASPAVVSEYSAPREFTPTPKFQYVALGNGRTSEQAARERVTRRIKPVMAEIPLRHNAWNHRKDITRELIRELRSQGLSAKKIAEKLGCQSWLINKRERGI